MCSESSTPERPSESPPGICVDFYSGKIVGHRSNLKSWPKNILPFVHQYVNFKYDTLRKFHEENPYSFLHEKPDHLFDTVFYLQRFINMDYYSVMQIFLTA